MKTPVHCDCTWDTLNRIILAALDRLAETFVPDHTNPDKRYDPSDLAGLFHKVYDTYYFSMWQAAGHHHILGAKIRVSGKKFNALAVV